LQYFIAGLVIGLLIGLGIFFISRPKKSRVASDDSEHADKLTELSKLTGHLAHEVKNPLSTIKVNLKLIAENLADAGSDCKADGVDSKNFDRPLRKIDVISKELDRVEQILADFLRYTGRSQLQTQSVDINEVVSDMADFYSPQAHSHSIKIRMTLCKESPICRIDTGMIKQVILNLFINAQQAMDTGGELMIRTEIDDDFGVIQVSDTGRGIGSEKLKNIFDAYYSTTPQGSGLGLATARKNIEEHGGVISVVSETEKGTAFTIKLPIQID